MTNMYVNPGFGRFLSVFLAAATLMFLTSCGEEPLPPTPPKPVKVLTITDAGDLSEGSFPGLAAASQEANMSFRVSGPLVELPVKVGDQVEAGSVIAKIDPNDFQVALTNAESLLAAAQASATRAEADYDRLISAQQEDPGATSQRAVDMALATRDAARAAVSSAEATTQAVRDRLSYTSMVAPFDGEVTQTYVENYESVVALQPIVRLVNRGGIEMTLAIPETLIGYADYITSVVVSFDALPGVVVSATVIEVGSEASQATRTYPLTVTMQQPGSGQILPGMAGQAKIQAELPDNASTGVHVPPTALFAGTDTERSYVWIVENKTVTRREVKASDLTTNGILISEGLVAGEVIVAAGVSVLAEGQSVEVIIGGEAK